MSTRSLSVAFFFSLLSLLWGSNAHAADPQQQEEEEVGPDSSVVPRPMLALAVGAATAFTSLTAGGMIIARSNEHDVRNAGLIIGTSGLSITPLLAHGVVDEWKRGALFSLIPLAAEAGLLTMTISKNDLLQGRASPFVQYSYFALLTISVFGAGLGVVDAVRVAERQPNRFVSSLCVTPVISAAMSGAVVQGAL